MPKGAPPSFDFFPDDWIGGTMALTLVEQGAYMRLLCWQWSRGYLPSRKSQRMQIVGVNDEGQWDRIWENLSDKFTSVRLGDIIDYEGPEPETLVIVNTRMHRERNRQLPAYHSRVGTARLNGCKGGRPRKSETQDKPRSKPKRNPAGFQNETQMKPVGNPSETQEKPTTEEGRVLNTHTQEVISSLEVDQSKISKEHSQPLSAPVCVSSSDSTMFGRARCPHIPWTAVKAPELLAAWDSWIEYVFCRDGRVNPIQIEQQVYKGRQVGDAETIAAISRSIDRGSRGGVYWVDMDGRSEQQRAQRRSRVRDALSAMKAEGSKGGEA